MKYAAVITVLIMVYAVPAAAQFRGEEPSQPSVADGFQRQENRSSFLPILSMDRLEMRHSVSMSYMSFGEQGIGMTMYTNSMKYTIADPLSVRADVSFMFSPFGSLSQSARDNLTGIYLRRASIDYVPSKDVHISLQYRNMPYSYMYSPFYGPYGFDSGFFMDDTDRNLR
jgi:hypothetical protein